MNSDKVVLVDRDDNEVGLMGKWEAHQNPGSLHRAISVVLWRNDSIPGYAAGATRSRDQVEVLLQQRSKKKPLWPQFWSDTCSTHPRPGESYEACARRRLREEMGIEYEGRLQLAWKLYYQADYNDRLAEHELDAVLVGEYEGGFDINTEEVMGAKWVGWDELEADIDDGLRYAPWFQLMVGDPRLREAMK